MKLYLINTYEAQMASEKGIYASTSKPKNTMYYKSEILADTDIELPDGFTYEKTKCGSYEIFKGNEAADLVTASYHGRYATYLITSDGVIKWHAWDY